ncbi:MAG: tyrosine-type recombinase/integrase, partial [Thermoplasmata archaeon]
MNCLSDLFVRYKLLLTILLRTGARISEALMLKQNDFDLATRNITMITLKKNVRIDKMKEYAIRKLPKRVLPMHQELKDATMAYFIDMHIDSKSQDLLFPISRITVDKYLTRMEKATGIKINAHKFRHTFPVRCLLDGVPVNVLQKWLAHSSLIVTSVYADVLSMDT